MAAGLSMQPVPIPLISNTANSANSAFANNSWMHLVMLLDRYNGTIRTFKDKALVASDTIRTTDTVSSSNPLLFGTSQEGNSDFSDIDGQMDDIRLYDRVLYSFEIENLYDAVVTDTDSDGLNDAEENLLDTHRISSDTDGDGLTISKKSWATIPTSKLMAPTAGHAAKADAENRGGYLATITSLEEKNKVENIRSSNSWLGASDTQTEGTWQWVTGEPWSYTFWNTSEPNGGTGENYLITSPPPMVIGMILEQAPTEVTFWKKSIFRIQIHRIRTGTGFLILTKLKSVPIRVRQLHHFYTMI